jgi:hypothetical protein
MIPKQILLCRDFSGNSILRKAQSLNTKTEKLPFNNLHQCKNMITQKSTEQVMVMDLKGLIFA